MLCGEERTYMLLSTKLGVGGIAESLKTYLFMKHYVSKLIYSHEELNVIKKEHFTANIEYGY